MRTVKSACIKPLAALLLLALAGCATSIVYTGSEIDPNMPIRIGDEITVTEKGADEKYRILVSSISETAISGSLVENGDREKSFTWADIREIDAGMSAGITFKNPSRARPGRWPMRSRLRIISVMSASTCQRGRPAS